MKYIYLLLSFILSSITGYASFNFIETIDSIEGPSLVCATVCDTFSISPTDPNSSYIWNFDGGVSKDGNNTDAFEEISWGFDIQGTTRTISITITDSNGDVQTINKQVYISTGVYYNGPLEFSIGQGGSAMIGPSEDEVPTGARFSWIPSFYLNSQNVRAPICSPPYDICYTLSITIGECSMDVELCVDVDPSLNPIADAGDNITSCDGTEVTLGGNPTGIAGDTSKIIGYDWRPSTGLSDPYIANPLVQPEQTITYKVIVFSNTGLTDTSAITVTVGESPIIVLDTIHNIRTGEQGAIFITGDENYIYNWTGPNGFISNDKNLIDLQDAGCYDVVVLDDISDCNMSYTFCIDNLNAIDKTIQDPKEIKVFPNPSSGSGMLFIDIGDNENATTYISIIGLDSKVYFDKEVNHSFNEIIEIVPNINNNGIFILKIENNNNVYCEMLSIVH